MEDIDDPVPEDNNEQQEDFPVLAIRERFVFKYQNKLGNDVESIVTTVDVTGMEFPKDQLDRALRGFFGFLENAEFESRDIFNRTMDTLISARLQQENPETFGKKIEVSQDVSFEAFLVRIRACDKDLLKELYHIYIGIQSLN